MSVINQMLKDLDERQKNATSSNEYSSNLVVKSSNKNVFFIFIAILLVVNVLGIAIWQLYQENQTLKIDKAASESAAEQAAVSLTAIVNEKANADSSTQILVEEKLVEEKLAEPTLTESKLHKQELHKQELVTDADNQGVTPNNQRVSAKTPAQENLPANAVQSVALTDSEKVANIEDNTTPHTTQQTAASTNVAGEPAVPQLTISRKQLSAEQLAKQKIAQAERALQNNELANAEQLFEEVLLVLPEHKVARKQLAALWFGRKSYQAALNLLSQGIALTPDDSEYRLMKARIYLIQGQRQAAVNTLKALADLADVEYQALLATNAQQTKQYQLAIDAFNILVKLQPTVGRWWLGLAVALDSDGQFTQAAIAYNKVKESDGLSESAQQFARQRLQELGE